MITDYAAVGPQELWNTTRLQRYLENLGSPFDTGSSICACEALTPQILGEDADFEYERPEVDPAPWYDEDLGVSAEFLGFLPMNVSGTTDNPYRRTVTDAVGGGAVFGPRRAGPRTITVTGLLIGTSCCGAEYGMHWLAEALTGCSGEPCDGDCFTMYDCCPEPGDDPDEFNRHHRRTFRRTALVDGPREIGRGGDASCARSACGGGQIIEVEFILVAATPWAWTDLTERMNIDLFQEPNEDCVEWCATRHGRCGSEVCKWAECRGEFDPCADPRNPVPRPPEPTLPDTAFCVPLATETTCYDLDMSIRPQWSDDAVTLTLLAGATELRNVRVTMYERRDGDTRPCSEVADESRCFPANEFFVTYVPPGGAVVVDGQINAATTQCEGECSTSSTVYGGQDGGPLMIKPLTCANYCVCIETDSLFPPGLGASLLLSTSGRGY